MIDYINALILSVNVAMLALVVFVVKKAKDKLDFLLNKIDNSSKTIEESSKELTKATNELRPVFIDYNNRRAAREFRSAIRS